MAATVVQTSMSLREEKEQIAALAIKYSVYLENGELTKNSDSVIQDGSSADVFDCNYGTQRVAAKALRHRTIDDKARKVRNWVLSHRRTLLTMINCRKSSGR